jgi:hypothetical protein
MQRAIEELMPVRIVSVQAAARTRSKHVVQVVLADTAAAVRSRRCRIVRHALVPALLLLSYERDNWKTRTLYCPTVQSGLPPQWLSMTSLKYLAPVNPLVDARLSRK